jgi:hypothetical protein
MEETLATATLEEIVAELQRRFPVVVIAGHREAIGGPDPEDETWITHAGNLHTCVGLATAAWDWLRAKVAEQLEPGEPR